MLLCVGFSARLSKKYVVIGTRGFEKASSRNNQVMDQIKVAELRFHQMDDHELTE